MTSFCRLRCLGLTLCLALVGAVGRNTLRWVEYWHRTFALERDTLFVQPDLIDTHTFHSVLHLWTTALRNVYMIIAIF